MDEVGNTKVENVKVTDDSIKIMSSVSKLIGKCQSITGKTMVLNQGEIKELPLNFFFGRKVNRVGNGTVNSNGESYQFDSEKTVDQVLAPIGQIFLLKDFLEEFQRKSANIICIYNDNIVEINTKFISGKNLDRNVNDSTVSIDGEIMYSVNQDNMKKLFPDIKPEELEAHIDDSPEKVSMTVNVIDSSSDDSSENDSLGQKSESSSMEELSDVLSDGWEEALDISDEHIVTPDSSSDDLYLKDKHDSSEIISEQPCDPREVFKVSSGKQEVEIVESFDV